MRLAVITARGGSKRIPRKNIREFCGKPMIAYSIEAALQSNFFDEVMVSTDEQEIADIAKHYGAKIPFMRSRENANDFATTANVLLEVIQKYKIIGKNFEHICCLYPAAPFVTTKNLQSAFNILIQDKRDTVFPIVRFSFPIQRALRFQDGKVSFMNPEFALTRSQDLEPGYHDAGQFYWVSVKAFLENRSLISHNSGAIVLPEWQAQDIDHSDDWVLAEKKYGYYVSR